MRAASAKRAAGSAASARVRTGASCAASGERLTRASLCTSTADVEGATVNVFGVTRDALLDDVPARASSRKHPRPPQVADSAHEAQVPPLVGMFMQSAELYDA